MAKEIKNSSSAQSGAAPKEKKKKGNVKKWKIALWIAILAFLALVVAVYVRLSLPYRDHFFKGTVINQIDASDKTVAEVEEEIAKRVEEYTLKVTFRGDVVQEIKAADIGYHFVSDGGAQRIMDGQHFLLWPKGYFWPEEGDVLTESAFDEEKLREVMMAMPEMQADKMEAPADAYVSFEGEAFTVVPETYGTTLDPERVIEAASKAVAESREELNVEEEIEDLYALPSIYQDNEELNAEAAELNELVKASITYQLPSGEQVLDGNTLKDWLVKDESGHYVKDEEIWNAKIAEYVENTAVAMKTVGTDRTFNATGIGEITVGGGTFGWRMNYNEELAQLTEELNNGVITTREPVLISREYSSENNGLGNTYIEVDMTRQHLWYYKDGQLALESDCVTGRMTKKRYTPSGIYYLTYKQRERDLRGEIDPETGEPEYISHVHYWMPFNKGIGFHDATWRSRFGGEIYINSGSHGCVNLPYKFAPLLYEEINAEMPIICYYSGGCKFEQPEEEQA